jgi:hypothetical protein
LRKRIFLTDRMERVEKALVQYGLVTETQMINQGAEDQEQIKSFVENLEKKT